MLTSDLAQYPPKWRAPVGCDHCQRTGYRGRIGIHELVPVTPDIQHQIVQGASVTQLRELARQQGVRNLREDGFVKAYQGITSVEEVLRVTAS
jgi:general secretion pathway protein E